MEYDRQLHLMYIMTQAFSSLVMTSNKIQVAGNEYFNSLTSRQYMTMLAVLHLPEDNATPINIAKKLGTTKQNVTQLIGSLQKKGFISARPSKKDRRSVNIHVTPAGMDVMINAGKTSSIDFMADIFKNFTEKEIEILWKLLAKLYSFDGSKMDGFQENVEVSIPDMESELKIALERFCNRRNKK